MGWRDKDLPALGWRRRRHYDLRATFITLTIEDGADPDVIETRVTHAWKARNVFDGYNRGLHWERTCGEILKLRITRGPQTSTIEQPLPAGGRHGPLPFAAVVASGGYARRKSGPARGETLTARA
jgi:hypothetical protein